MKRRLTLGFAAIIAASTLCACGASQADQLIAKRSIDERLQTYSTVLSQLGASPEAEKTRIEIDQAAGWLRRAEALSVTPEGATSARMDMLLDVIDGQLVRVKAEQARQAAARRFEGERGRYEGEMGRFESIQKKNDELRQGGPQ